MGIFQLIFGSGKKAQAGHAQTKQPHGIIMVRQEPEASATDDLKKLWDGSDMGMNFISPLAYAAVSVPRTLAGAPIFSSGDRLTQEWIDSFAPYVFDNAPIITQTKLITGTAWRFPMWDARSRSVIWASIPDDDIISIKTDLDTGEITDIYTEVQVERTREWFDKDVAVIKRHYSRSSIMTEIDGRKIERDNYFGILPLPFGHDCFEGEFRGTSIFARSYRTMKSTHDIIFNRDLILSTFKPKLIQTVAEADKSAVEAWKANNNISEEKHLDPFDHEIYVNLKDESTQFLFLPSDATAQHTAAIENNIKRVILGSGVPELFYGMLATGTQAANDAQVRLAVEYIKDLQREDISWYKDLINYSARIYGYANVQRLGPVDVSYTKLDMLSTVQRATVFNNYASGIATLMNARALTSESAVYFTELFFSDYPHKTAEEFIDAAARMAAGFPTQYEGADVF
jgi:hypothetical protein